MPSGCVTALIASPWIWIRPTIPHMARSSCRSSNDITILVLPASVVCQLQRRSRAVSLRCGVTAGNVTAAVGRGRHAAALVG